VIAASIDFVARPEKLVGDLVSVTAWIGR